MKEMCEMDRRIVLSSPHSYYGELCPSHSIGYYIGLLNNKECENITDDDMTTTLQVIQICSRAILYVNTMSHLP